MRALDRRERWMISKRKNGLGSYAGNVLGQGGSAHGSGMILVTRVR
jgi:hypothetical protein